MEIVNYLFFIISALFIIFYFRLIFIKNREFRIFKEIQEELKNIVKNNSDNFEIFNRINSLISNGKYDDYIISKVIKFLISNRDVSNWDLGVIRNVIFDYGNKKFGLFSYISLAPNIFLLLGIIGTIIGLKESIESLSFNLRDISVIDPKAVYSLLAGNVIHIKDAFNYSLRGISFSIISFILLRTFIQSYNYFLFQMEETVFYLVSPFILHKTYLTKLENIEKIIRYIESVLDLYKQKLNETLVIYVKIKQDLTQINALFEYNIKLIKDIIDKNLKEKLEIFVSTSENLEQQLKNISDNLSTINKQLFTILEDIKNYNQNFVDISKSQITTIEGYKNIFEEKMKNVAEKFEEKMKGVAEKMEYLIGLFGKLQEYESFDREERIKAIKYELRETLRGFLIDFKEEIKKNL